MKVSVVIYSQPILLLLVPSAGITETLATKLQFYRRKALAEINGTTFSFSIDVERRRAQKCTKRKATLESGNECQFFKTSNDGLD